MYNDKNELPPAILIDEFNPFDDFTLVPTDGLELLKNPDYSLSLEVIMDNLGDGAN